MVDANAARAEQSVAEATQQLSAEIVAMNHMCSSEMSALDVWRRAQLDMRSHEDSLMREVGVSRGELAVGKQARVALERSLLTARQEVQAADLRGVEL